MGNTSSFLESILRKKVKNKKREKERGGSQAPKRDWQHQFDWTWEMILWVLVLPQNKEAFDDSSNFLTSQMPKQTSHLQRPSYTVPSILSQSLCKECMGQASQSLIWVLALWRAAAVLKACFRVSITSSTYRKKQSSGL